MSTDGVEPPDPTIEGWVDGCLGGVIHGWARWPGRPGEKPVIDVLVDGVMAGCGLAALPRQDLARHGHGDGQSGFAIPLDPDVWQDRLNASLQAVVRVRDGALVPGGTLALDASSLVFGQAPAPAAPAIWPPLPWELHGTGLIGFIDRFGPEHVEGWAHHPDRPAAKVVLELWEGAEKAGSVTAEFWRIDLEETRQGDGRWSLHAALPMSLRDGRVHCLRLLLPDGTPALKAPVLVQLPGPGAPAGGGLHSAPADGERPSLRHRPAREAPPGMMFSIIINFYNMTREAERTLTSLTRTYQRNIGDLRYEVLCIDNGSTPPLDPAWVAEFGPEFRLIRPSRQLPSPCAAINEAAAQAAGQSIAIMIDGAHILTPGTLREVWDAVTEAPDAVVALRQWFVGGDQRWLATVGYTRTQEDLLFDKINWPADGYQLFRVGAPIWESPNHWFDGLIESNCLFIPGRLYRQIGGIDEDFDEPGAGYANLDLFRRAADASIEPVVALIGEASFHQFHDGTTTNVDTAMKEARVRGYENRYVALRGKPYAGVDPVDIRVRGQLHTLQAVMTRQRPLSPARIGVTDRIRPGVPAVHFDEKAQEYLQSAYVEFGLHERATWLGHRLDMAPSDALAIQELVFRLRPSRIVTVNAAPGLLWLLDSLLRVIGQPDCRVVAVNAASPVAPPGSVYVIEGRAAAAETQAAVASAVGAAEGVLVLFAPDEDDALPIAALRAFARIVTCRSYLVFLGTALGQPWLGYSRRWYMTAIRMLLAVEPFVIDMHCNVHMATTSPLGYLQRVEAQVD